MTQKLYRSILLIGPPGSGKGTVGKKLAMVTDHYHLSSGEIFRSIPRDSQEAKIQQEFLAKGNLVPDEVTIKICTSYIEGLVKTFCFNPQRQLLILDGIPRTTAQAQFLDLNLDMVAILKLELKDEEVLIKRLEKRAILEGRGDDSRKDILKKRIDVYKNQTEEVLSFYPKDKVITVDGDQAPLAVFREVLNKLSPFLGDR